jgi:hypothetical protein
MPTRSSIPSPSKLEFGLDALDSLRARSPEIAALQLAESLGVAKALFAAANELRHARRARSRIRYQFWASVHDRIAQATREDVS